MQTILVVDDDQNVLQSLSTIFKMSGYRVLAAENFDQAQRQFVANSVELLIVDHGLSGVTGSVLAKRFKEIKPVRVIMLTGNAELLGRPDGVDVLIPKPTDVPTLLAEIGGLLSRSAGN